MSRYKKDIFREVISKAEAQKPTDDIADLVMQQITASTQDEVTISPALESLLQHAADMAPLDLTRNVMTQVNPQQAQVIYKPIISKRAWYVIAASVLCILITATWLGGSEQHAFSSSIGGNTIKQVGTLPPVYIITLTFAGLLLVLEHLITNGLKLHK